MNKQMANFGRRLSSADMKKMLGGGPGIGGTGTGTARCGTPPAPPNCDVIYNGRCCTCCAGLAGAACRVGRSADPACALV
jgi:hypothetical protein